MRPLKHFLKHERGVALIEFVLVFPLLFLLLFGSIEVIRLLYVNQKVEKAVYAIGDVVTRYLPATNPLTAGEISVTEMNTNVFPIFGRIMNEASLKVPGYQAVIVTSVTRQGIKRVKWQIAAPGGGNTDNLLSGCDSFGNCVTSIVDGLTPGAINGAVVNRATSFPAAEEATLSTMANGENMIVVEVFYYYHPIMQTLLQNMSSLGKFNFYLQPRIYTKRMYFAPRDGALTYLPPTFPAP